MSVVSPVCAEGEGLESWRSGGFNGGGGGRRLRRRLSSKLTEISRLGSGRESVSGGPGRG